MAAASVAHPSPVASCPCTVGVSRARRFAVPGHSSVPGTALGIDIALEGGPLATASCGLRTQAGP